MLNSQKTNPDPLGMGSLAGQFFKRKNTNSKNVQKRTKTEKKRKKQEKTENCRFFSFREKETKTFKNGQKRKKKEKFRKKRKIVGFFVSGKNQKLKTKKKDQTRGPTPREPHWSFLINLWHRFLAFLTSS